MSNATTETTTATPDKLETETCSRCGGSGEFSYCQMYGTKCFKCGGRKVVLTKRGAAAQRYLTEIRSKRVDALVPGDEVWSDGIPGFTKGEWVQVTEAPSHYDSSGGYYTVNGVRQPVRDDLLSVKGVGHGLAPENLVRVRQTPEQVRETMARAVAYQATLTKTGKPAKRRAS